MLSVLTRPDNEDGREKPHPISNKRQNKIPEKKQNKEGKGKGGIGWNKLSLFDEGSRCQKSMRKNCQ